MKKKLQLSVMIMIPFAASTQSITIGKIEIFDPRMETIIDKEMPIEVLTDQMQWAEGPVWVANGSFLLFSDPQQNIIFKWTRERGIQPFLKPSGYTGRGIYSEEPGANGLLINHDGELIACEHGDRRVSRMNLEKGGKVTIVDNWRGKRFNSPNDICQHSNGTYYFTDPPYGLPDREKDTTNREIAHNGVYSVDQDGRVEQIIVDLHKPNGIALSPDERTLFVAQSDAEEPYIKAYSLTSGKISSAGSIFFDFKKQLPYSKAQPDGIKVDAEGNLFAAAADGIVVIALDGKPLGRIYTGVKTANCALADDGYLYITASNYVLRVKLRDR